MMRGGGRRGGRARGGARQCLVGLLLLPLSALPFLGYVAFTDEGRVLWSRVRGQEFPDSLPGAGPATGRTDSPATGPASAYGRSARRAPVREASAPVRPLGKREGHPVPAGDAAQCPVPSQVEAAGDLLATGVPKPLDVSPAGLPALSCEGASRP